MTNKNPSHTTNVINKIVIWMSSKGRRCQWRRIPVPELDLLFCARWGPLLQMYAYAIQSTTPHPYDLLLVFFRARALISIRWLRGLATPSPPTSPLIWPSDKHPLPCTRLSRNLSH